MRCKTYCFAFQKRLFCAAKPTLLPCKTAAFATPKRSYHFLRVFSLQNQSYLQHLPQVIKEKQSLNYKLLLTEIGLSKSIKEKHEI